MSDQEIVQLCLDPLHRERGYRLLVSTYSKKIYWHVRRMVTDHDDANDVVQNIFIKVWKGLPEFRADSKLYT
ncbi:MAG: RNA polymerase subunit sigma, partial [Chitinophagales bacterium]|nr:RNA polymerase subunit sigma [Chitinophagales bacterium]